MWNIAFSEIDRSKKRAAGKWKFFDPTIFSKMLARCGRAAHICEANMILESGFPAAIAFLKLSNSNKVVSWESRLQIQTRQGGNCSMLVGKSRGGTPFCRMRKIGFPKRSSSRETIWIRFGRNASLSACVLFAGGCVVRIAYECFLDYSLQEVFMFLEWRTAFPCFS